MSAQWDGRTEVAIISWQSQSGRSGGSALALRCSREYGESHWTTQTFGEISDHKVTKVRPLVVIDPEDREQVEQVARAFALKFGGYTESAVAGVVTDTMQDALREFANPKPPRPEEPAGLGAVVEDADGACWVRVSNRESGWRQSNGGRPGLYRTYAEIEGARILSAGVTP